MSKGRIVDLSYGDEKKQTTTQRHPLGTKGELPDGRLFRYSFSDGAITAGLMLQTKVAIAEDDMDVVVAAAAAAKATSISITTVAAILADEYKDGFLYVNDGAGQGQAFRLGSHLAAGAAATLVLNLAEGEEVITALAAATSLVGLKWNRYKDVIVSPTTITGIPVGATPMDVADNRYFWAQVRGEAAILVAGTAVVSKAGIVPGNVAGGVAPQVDAGGDDPVVCWFAAPVGVDTDYAHVFLRVE